MHYVLCVMYDVLCSYIIMHNMHCDNMHYVIISHYIIMHYDYFLQLGTNWEWVHTASFFFTSVRPDGPLLLRVDKSPRPPVNFVGGMRRLS